MLNSVPKSIAWLKFSVVLNPLFIQKNNFFIPPKEKYFFDILGMTKNKRMNFENIPE